MVRLNNKHKIFLVVVMALTSSLVYVSYEGRIDPDDWDDRPQVRPPITPVITTSVDTSIETLWCPPDYTIVNVRGEELCVYVDAVPEYNFGNLVAVTLGMVLGVFVVIVLQRKRR